MTDQIKPNDELKTCLKQSKTTGKNRAVKILIQDGKLVKGDSIETSGKWSDDHDQLVSRLFTNGESSIVLIRLETKNKSGLFEWLLIQWSGVDEALGNQMDSIMASLQKEMSNTIKSHFIASKHDDLKLDSCVEHLNSLPLTSITNNNNKQSNGCSDADKNGEEDDGGDEDETVSKSSKKKKNKKKKCGTVNSGDGVQSDSCPSKTAPSSTSKSKGVQQTDPPTIPISLLFPSSNYPVGQIMDHPLLDGSVILFFFRLLFN